MTVILGINAVYHETSAALVIDGELKCAAEEERFNRVKHGKRATPESAADLPAESIRWCLAETGVKASSVDAVALSFNSGLRRKLFSVDPLSVEGEWGSASGELRFLSALDATPRAVRSLLGPSFDGDLICVPHHRAHAASAFYPSGFREAAVLVVDGIAEASCSALFQGTAEGIKEYESIDYPHSIGFLWEKFSQYFGFSEYDACKTMGLAAYGDAGRFKNEFSEIVLTKPDGSYQIKADTLCFRLPDFRALERTFGARRISGDEFEQRHYDIAAALQGATNTVLLGLAARAMALAGSRHLCIAGGVALNCVANDVLHRHSAATDIYIPSAPHDAGTAIGAAFEVARRKHDIRSADTAYLGPQTFSKQVSGLACDRGVSFDNLDELNATVVKLLCEGNIIGWFQGAVEFGPRALGNRSLLADPRRSDMREILNRKVKHREDFRPFGPSVLAEEAERWFDIKKLSKSHGYMLFAVPVCRGYESRIPAVLHTDNTARIQVVTKSKNDRFYNLIKAFFAATGVPMLLNTSFNDSEPIVLTPQDAAATFAKTAIDALVIDNSLFYRDAIVTA